MWAILLYTLVIFSFIQGWELLAFSFILIFSFWYNAVALIPLAILIDGYFGNFYDIPVLSFMAVIWFVVVEYLQPKIANLRRI